MTHLTRRALMGALTLATVPPSWALARSEDAGARLRALLRRSAAEDGALAPLEAETTAPVSRPAAFVNPLSDRYADTLRQNKQRDLRELATIDRHALGEIDRIAYDVFDYASRQTLAPFDNGLFELARRAPLDSSFGLHVELPDYVSGGGAAFATLADFEAGLQRLNGFADYLEATVARLREGMALGVFQPRTLVELILSQVQAMLSLPQDRSPFLAAFRQPTPALAPAQRDRLEAGYRQVVERRILPGYRLWQQFLTQVYLPRANAAPGRWAIPGGDALYASELARHTTTTLPPLEIHTQGLAEVTRIRGEMEQVRETLRFSGDLKALFDFVRTDPQFYCKTPEELLGRFAAIEARIWPGIPALFRRRPHAPFRVAPLPALGEQRGTGYYRPGPPDGQTPGTLYFNMAMLNTRPIPTLETLTLHEGIPGHHFQLTLARENTELPDLLRFGTGTAYTEGWGLYAESLGRDLGLFTDPWQWFGHLDMEMLRAVRMVVDTGIHARQWTRQQAIDYMLANTSMAPRDVAVEIDRYIAYPGQACAYKVGELTFQRLRAQAQSALGSRFDIRDYHAQVLDTGVLPMAVLETKISNWVARSA